MVLLRHFSYMDNSTHLVWNATCAAVINLRQQNMKGVSPKIENSRWWKFHQNFSFFSEPSQTEHCPSGESVTCNILGISHPQYNVRGIETAVTNSHGYWYWKCAGLRWSYSPICWENFILLDSIKLFSFVDFGPFQNFIDVFFHRRIYRK